jgi:predicted exporter
MAESARREAVIAQANALAESRRQAVLESYQRPIPGRRNGRNEELALVVSKTYPTISVVLVFEKGQTYFKITPVRTPYNSDNDAARATTNAEQISWPSLEVVEAYIEGYEATAGQLEEMRRQVKKLEDAVRDEDRMRRYFERPAWTAPFGPYGR